MNKEKTNSPKTIFKFLIFIAISAMIGALSSLVFFFIDENITSLNDVFYNLISFIEMNIFSIISIIWAILFIGITTLLIKIKSLGSLDNLTDEKEDLADNMLNLAITLNTVNFILVFLGMGISFTNLAAKDINIGFSASVIIIYILFFIVVTLIETYCFKCIRLIHPEKQTTNLSMNFEKEWIEHCDEGERMMTYVTGHKVSLLMKKVFIFTFTFLILLGMFVNIGILPLLLVGTLWGIFTVSYSIYSVKVEKGHIKY